MMIFDLPLTSLIPLSLIGIILYGSKNAMDDSFFMSKGYGNFLKGLCAVIVVLFHFPQSCQNPLQHFMGGFAFVAVTLFFLFSSYGMQLNVEHNPSYLHLFWKKRLLGLLCPVLVVNISFFFLQSLFLKKVDLEILYHVDEYVIVLLQYCLLFYVTNYLYKKAVIRSLWQIDALLIVGVIVSSLIVVFSLPSNSPSGENYWYVERYGLIWGLLLYRYFPNIVQWLNASRNIKSIILLITSILVLVAYHSLKQHGIGYRYIFEMLSALFLVLLIFLLTQRKVYGNKLSFFLGSISYEVYLSHRNVMEIILNISPSLSSGIFITLVVLITLLFSCVANLLCKRLLHYFL